MFKPLRRLLRTIATVLPVPILLLEGRGWEPLARQVPRIARQSAPRHALRAIEASARRQWRASWRMG